MSNYFSFRPFPFFSGCHQQTILASFITFYRAPRSVRQIVTLPDGDKLSLEISTPRGWTEDQPTAILVHGLCGSHKSSQMIRMTKKLYRKGLRTIRVNMRGCGSGRGLARKLYHSGSSDDLKVVLKQLKKETPDSDFIVIGFSLGGNIALKLGGELNSHAHKLISRIIAINPPADLYASVQKLDDPKNRLYSRYFLRNLKAEVLHRQNQFSDLADMEIPNTSSVFEFDELYMAPQSGFQSAIEYYNACSSAYFIPYIEIPTHILFSKDDPIIDCSIVERLRIPDNVKITVTENGGHLGFLGDPRKEGKFLWLDAFLIKVVFNQDNERAD